MATNCWLFPLDEAAPEGGDGRRPCAVFDPGEQGDLIVTCLEDLGLYPRYILLTHGHFDHLAALPDLAAAFRDRAPEIALHRDDGPYLGPAAYPVHRESFIAVAGSAAYIDALWKPLPSPTRLLTEGDRIGPFQVLHLPGHSPGSAGFFWAPGKLLFSGDTLFRGDVGRTDLPGGDPRRLRESLKRLLAMDGDIRVYPGHGPATTIAGEQALGDLAIF